MGKLAIVTGASSGIGLAIAENLAEHGYQAVCWDIQPPKESKIPYFHCDVTSEEGVKKAYAAAKEKFGPAQVIVNNCGFQFLSPIEDFPLEKWNALIGVMLTGTFLCTREVFKDMKAQKSGRIVNISSVHGKLASPFKSAYVSAKHGVLGLTKTCALEGAEFGITANAVCPGFVDTPLMRGQVQKQMELNKMTEGEVMSKIFLKEQCIKKLSSPKQVAEMVAYLCSDFASTITGEALNMTGGWGMGL